MRRARMGCSIFVGLLAATSISAAEEFRIETRLYSGSQPSFSTTTTLFQNGEVFDYLEPADGEKSKGGLAMGEVTVFQPTRKRFVILSGNDRVRTSLSFEQIQQELEKVRKSLRLEAKRLAKLKNPLANKQSRFYAFLADPSFTEQYDDRSGVLLLSSEFLTYRIVTTEVRRRGIVDQIRELSDWQVKLNHLLHGAHGALPPYPRLAVNAALAKRNRVAKEIHRTRSTAKQPVQNRAKHELTLGLRKEHYRRIAITRQQLKDFDSIAFNEFLRRSAKTARDGSRNRTKRR